MKSFKMALILLALMVPLTACHEDEFIFHASGTVTETFEVEYTVEHEYVPSSEYLWIERSSFELGVVVVDLSHHYLDYYDSGCLEIEIEGTSFHTGETISDSYTVSDRYTGSLFNEHDYYIGAVFDDGYAEVSFDDVQFDFDEAISVDLLYADYCGSSVEVVGDAHAVFD